MLGGALASSATPVPTPLIAYILQSDTR